MSLKVKGIIKQLLNAESGVSRAGNEWKKQEFIIETDDQYPKLICFTLFNDKLSVLENFNTGDEVEVYFNLESREYNGRWFTNVNAWKLEKPTLGVNQDAPPEYKIDEIPPESSDSDGDGLPF